MRNYEQYKKGLEQEEKRVKEDNNPEYAKKWKNGRNGVITFAVIHFIYEIFIGNPTTGGALAIVNALIALFILMFIIRPHKENKQPFVIGLSVSCIVFLIRLIIGTILINS